MKKLRGWLVFSVILLQALIPAKVEAATIFVDGMSFEITRDSLIKFIESKDHYRAPYLHSSDLGESIKSIDPKQNFVAWSGNAMSPEDVKQAIAKLKDEIIAFHNTSPHEPINIVSHSYGTVIAYKALEEISIEHPDIKINTFITMGSPLGKDSVGQILAAREALDIPANENLKTPANVEYWINFYAEGDGFSGEIDKEGVKDIFFPKELLGSSSPHACYFENPNLYRIVSSFYKDAEKIFSFNETVRNESITLSQETVKNLSIQQATKYADLTYKIPFAEISRPELAKKISLDSSQQADYTAQQLLTPINVSFTQTFDGLFTQSADYLGSIGGDHSGIFTDGTRIGVGSRPGDFTSGSFSGRTIAELGYTPATWTNEPFSGSSVGTATARGFQEGDLKGDMTITVPTGTQTATLSGKITIKTDGSLDMPSYSGPITDSSIGGQKVGTMSGSGNQGPTH